MKSLLIILLFIMPAKILIAQIYLTKTATVSFHSHTWLENIDAVNKNSSAVIDVVKKSIAFSMMLKDFSFERKLMQEHFNENYVESDKYPKSTFSGSYTGNVDINKNGIYSITVQGKLTLHGVTKDVNVPATLTVNNGVITGASSFKLNPKDFNISIPFIVRDKIEKENTVKIKADWIINK